MFTKQKVKNFRSDFQNAVAELEGQYGVNINLGTITWDSKSVSVKMKAIVGEKFIAPTKDEFNVGDRVLINHKKVSNRQDALAGLTPNISCGAQRRLSAMMGWTPPISSTQCGIIVPELM